MHHMMGMTEKTTLTFRLTVAEANVLYGYAQQAGRTQSDILRQFIRTLQRKKLKRSDPAA
jgi:hypothetical protein